MPWTVETITTVAMAHMGRLATEELSLIDAEHRALLMPYTLALGELANQAAREHTLAHTLTAETELYRPLGALLDRYDTLICPTWATQGLPAGLDLINAPLPVNDITTTWEQQIMTIAFNIMSRVPVLNVPSGLAPNGVPTGVQIVGRTYDDISAFRIGHALETAHNHRWWSAENPTRTFA